MSRIAVIGAGAWGTALAMVAGRRGDHEVRLWALEKDVVASVARARTNDLFLPGFPLPDSINVTNDFREALSGAEIIVSVMPSHHCRRTFEHMAQWLQPQMLFVSATKGVENDTLLRMTEVIHEVVGQSSADLRRGLARLADHRLPRRWRSAIPRWSRWPRATALWRRRSRKISATRHSAFI